MFRKHLFDNTSWYPSMFQRSFLQFLMIDDKNRSGCVNGTTMHNISSNASQIFWWNHDYKFDRLTCTSLNIWRVNSPLIIIGFLHTGCEKELNTNAGRNHIKRFCDKLTQGISKLHVLERVLVFHAFKLKNVTKYRSCKREDNSLCYFNTVYTTERLYNNKIASMRVKSN